MSHSDEISHEGVVEHVEGSDVRVRIVQNAACAGCAARGACVASETAVKIIDATAPDGTLHVGDKVTVSVSKRLGWRAVLLAFILPFIVMMLVLSCLIYSGADEVMAGVGAIIALIPYYAIIYIFRARIKAQYSFVAKLKE